MKAYLLAVAGLRDHGMYRGVGYWSLWMVRVRKKNSIGGVYLLVELFLLADDSIGELKDLLVEDINEFISLVSLIASYP